MWGDNAERNRKRIDEVMKHFVPTPDVIESIIALNDGLCKRFRMAYDDLMMTKRFVDDEIRNGRLPVSGYEVFPEYFFGCDREEGIPTAADGSLFMDLGSETCSMLMPSLELNATIVDVDFDSFLGRLEDLNWNIESLDLPGLEKHHIHYFMHWMFNDAGTFCPADIPYLRPEDLAWQITVQFEFFNK